ncbi:MAG TPA: LytTR family DNA-binding domain-containing protein [Rhodocyclaceae bacterium]|nr:LytTR family DNA-binding domain-containing protein [Rhodocyclaceae bacterium]
MALRLLIADDEAPLRAWLRRLLAQVAPDAELVAECTDGDRALADIDTLRPDVAFLDIRMPGLSGLEVAARAGTRCRVVFVTAYDEFAVEAFERAAVDYLLKPVTADRLAKTMERLGRSPAPDDQTALLKQLLVRLDTDAKPRSLRWLRVGNADAVQLIDVDQVDRFEAGDKYTTLFVGAREWIVRTPLKEIEQQLDPDQFWRVHRGTVLRVAAIKRVQRDLMGHLWAELEGGGQRVAISRRYAQLFRHM